MRADALGVALGVRVHHAPLEADRAGRARARVRVRRRRGTTKVSMVRARAVSPGRARRRDRAGGAPRGVRLVRRVGRGLETSARGERERASQRRSAGEGDEGGNASSWTGTKRVRVRAPRTSATRDVNTTRATSAARERRAIAGSRAGPGAAFPPPSVRNARPERGASRVRREMTSKTRNVHSRSTFRVRTAAHQPAGSANLGRLDAIRRRESKKKRHVGDFFPPRRRL